MKSYQEFCITQAKRLFEIIETHGSLLSWRKGWVGQVVHALPQGSSGYYKGGNLFSLLFAQLDNGFKSDKRLTFNQINKLGGQVLKGAKSEEVGVIDHKIKIGLRCKLLKETTPMRLTKKPQWGYNKS